MTFPNDPSPNRLTLLYFLFITFTSLDSLIRDTFRVTFFGYARKKSLKRTVDDVVVVASLSILLLDDDSTLSKTFAGSCFKIPSSSLFRSVDLEHPILLLSTGSGAQTCFRDKLLSTFVARWQTMGGTKIEYMENMLISQTYENFYIIITYYIRKLIHLFRSFVL